MISYVISNQNNILLNNNISIALNNRKLYVDLLRNIAPPKIKVALYKPIKTIKDNTYLLLHMSFYVVSFSNIQHCNLYCEIGVRLKKHLHTEGQTLLHLIFFI